MRILKIILIILAIVLLTGILYLASALSFRTSDKKTEEYFREHSTYASIHRKMINGREIRFIETKPKILTESTSLLIFVHGAPGSADNFHKYLADSTLRQHARMISIDRPGYGYSEFGEAMVSISEQAAILKEIALLFPSQKKIIIGHSYGGPIIAQAVIDNPGLFSAILMLAPVNAPQHEEVFWYVRFTRWKATRWLLSKAWRVSGDEKMAHIEELEKMKDNWKQLSLPVVHIHGEKDWLAPKENIAFSEKHISPEWLKMVVLPESSHFIPWTDYDVVKKELMQILIH
ncbi:MAG: alpha/beta hydrolase [Bacteroidetes bacterium]|nr:alpha/beta hydrolase [Bacteroidota bacterium]